MEDKLLVAVRQLGKTGSELCKVVEKGLELQLIGLRRQIQRQIKGDKSIMDAARIEFFSRMKQESLHVRDCGNGLFVIHEYERNQQTIVGMSSIVPAYVDKRLADLCREIAADLRPS